MGKINKILLGALSFTACASALFAVATMQSCKGGGEGFRSHLDEYVALESEAAIQAHAMNPGVSVYVDFSDGMNAAYGTQVSQDALRKVINVFTGAENQASFYSLANDEIVPMEMAQTEIYNAIMSGKNYTKPKAPIEKTLKEILAKKQRALLITDFEEYNGSVIQQQNYAKDYFIKWLSSGYNIVFYKIDYKEGSKPKHLYFAVFDGAENALASNVETALGSYVGNGVERFILGGPDCSYDIRSAYPSSTQGGNYHSMDGVDLVTGVIEDGTEEAYIRYQNVVGESDASKSQGGYSPLNTLYGPFVEYYPLTVPWEEVVANISALQEEGVEKGDRFTHLLSKMYVNFNVQDGYDISGLEARVFNFEPQIQAIMMEKEAAAAEEREFKMPKLDSPKEVLDMFTVTMIPVDYNALPGAGWNEIAVDLDSRFKGTLPATMTSPKDLLKVNIVISKATPKLGGIDEFFAWPGNTSLSESVKNTLMSSEVNPMGRVILTYYLKVM